MDIRYLYREVRIDDRTKGYITKRLEILERILKDILYVAVEIDRDKKGMFRIEVMVKTPHKLYRAEETSQSIEGSVDIVENELKEQVRRDTERTRSLRKRGAQSLKKKIVLDENARF